MLAVVTANCLLLPLSILDLLLQGAADAILRHLELEHFSEGLDLDDFFVVVLHDDANMVVVLGNQPLPHGCHVSRDVYQDRPPDAPEKEGVLARAVVVLVDQASFEDGHDVAATKVELQEVSAVIVRMDDAFAVPGG